MAQTSDFPLKGRTVAVIKTGEDGAATVVKFRAAPDAKKEKKLSEQLTCPVCAEIFEDTVTTRCGHSFCRACIVRCVSKSGPDCPVCRSTVRESELTKNYALREISKDGKKRLAEGGATGAPKKKRPDVEYFLCGGLCGEITSPLLAFDLTVRPASGQTELYVVEEVRRAKRRSDQLTTTTLKRMLNESEYVTASSPAARTKALHAATAPLRDRGLAPSDRIDGQSTLDCLLSVDVPPMRFVCKNAFATPERFRVCSLFGAGAADGFSPEELERLCALFDPKRAGGPPEGAAELFERLCFERRIAEARVPADLPDAARVRRASVLYHDMKDKRDRFGDTAFRAPGWDEGTAAVLSKHVAVWKDPATERMFLVPRDVWEAQTSLTRALDSAPLTLIRAETDSDHESPAGYFDALRTLVARHAPNVLLVSCTRKRTYYLGQQVSAKVVGWTDAGRAVGAFASPPVVVADRSHALDLFHMERLAVDLSGRISRLYLCGSKLCLPDGVGQPFFDLHEAVSRDAERPDHASARRSISTVPGIAEVNKRRVSRFLPRVEDAAKYCVRVAGPCTVFVGDEDDRKKAIEGCPPGQSVHTAEEVGYEFPCPRAAVLMLFETKMSVSALARFISSCSPDKTKAPLVAVGQPADLNAVLSQRTRRRTSAFPSFLLHHWSNGALG